MLNKKDILIKVRERDDNNENIKKGVFNNLLDELKKYMNGYHNDKILEDIFNNTTSSYWGILGYVLVKDYEDWFIDKLNCFVLSNKDKFGNNEIIFQSIINGDGKYLIRIIINYK